MVKELLASLLERKLKKRTVLYKGSRNGEFNVIQTLDNVINYDKQLVLKVCISQVLIYHKF